MGQKVSTQVTDKSRQDKAKWDLYIFILKMLGKDHEYFDDHKSWN